jgi:hypothetical protein
MHGPQRRIETWRPRGPAAFGQAARTESIPDEE